MSLSNYPTTINYLPFDYRTNLSIGEIAFKTKKLISSSDNYNEYIQKFYNHTKLVTFKLPLIATDQNFKRKKINTDGFLTRNNSPVKFRLSDNSTYKNSTSSYTSPVRTQNGDRLINLKNNIFKKFNIKEKNNDSNENDKTDYDNIGTNLLRNSNMFITDPFPRITIKNSFGEMKKKLSVMQQYTENFFYFDNCDAEYDEREIFNKKEYYKNLIKEKLFYGEEVRSRTPLLQKIFNLGTSKEISLTLHSIKISFKTADTDTDSEVKEFGCIFPLELLPIFYHLTLDNFKLIMLSVLRFDLNFDNVVLNDEDIFASLKLLMEKETDLNITDYFKRGVENVYRFKWLTPDHIFQVEIKLPYIEINTKKNSRIIEKFIDPELLFYILNLDFQNWDFFCANFLISHLNFRKYLNKLYSKASAEFYKQRNLAAIRRKKLKKKIQDRILNKLVEETNEKEIKSNEMNSVTLNITDESNLNTTEVKVIEEIFPNEQRLHEYTDKNFQLYFLVTAACKNLNTISDNTDNVSSIPEYLGYLYQLTSFSVDILNSAGAKQTIYLNFNQMRILSHLSKFGNIENLLKKLVLSDINKTTYYIDFSFFDKFDTNDPTLLDYLFYFSNKKENYELNLISQSFNQIASVTVNVNWPKVTRTTVLIRDLSKMDQSTEKDKTEDKFVTEEMILDKNSLNKICVKDINLMIQIIEKEICFVVKKEFKPKKTLMLKIPKIGGINRLLTTPKARSPKLRKPSSVSMLTALDLKQDT